MLIIKIELLCISFILFWNNQMLNAQSMSSPYSVYGVGDIDKRIYNGNPGMGYTGLAIKTTLFTKGTNAASVAGIPKSFFMLDASGAGQTVNYLGTPINSSNETSKDFGIKNISFSTKINSFWGTSVGLQQFSNVSYRFFGSKEVVGSNQTYPAYYSGDGGLNNYFWNNGFSIGKHLSVGITASLIAGSINQTEIINQTIMDSLESKRNDFYSNMKLDYGFIYSAKLNKKWELSVAGQFSEQTRLDASRSLTVMDNATVLTSDQFIKYNAFSLPYSISAGIAVSNTNGVTYAADYSYEAWSSLNDVGNNWRLVNSQSFSAGAEFATFTNSFNKSSIKKAFQLGAFYRNSYLVVNNHQINEFGITGGISRSLKTGFMYGFSLEAGSRGTTSNNLIKENYLQFTLSLSLRDRFYSQGHKYD